MLKNNSKVAMTILSLMRHMLTQIDLETKPSPKMLQIYEDLVKVNSIQQLSQSWRQLCSQTIELLKQAIPPEESEIKESIRIESETDSYTEFEDGTV